MARILNISLTIVGLCAAAWQFAGVIPVQAAPIEFVRICSNFGLGYFFIPGTDICQNANQISANQAALSAFSAKAFQGVAISTAIVAPFVPTNANYAISVHWAGFDGSNAIGLGALARFGNTNFFLSGGVGTGVTGGPSAERAGFMFAW